MFSSIMSLVVATSILAEMPKQTVYYDFKEYPVTYEEIVEEATFNCPNRTWHDVDENLLWKLVEIEKKYKEYM